MFSFGKIFRYKEEYYIYLVQVSDVIYAAKILTSENTKMLLRLRDGTPRGGGARTDAAPMYSFVILSTEDFCELAAHYAQPGMPHDLVCETMGDVNEEDRNALIGKIVDDPASPIALREAISTMFPKK